MEGTSGIVLGVLALNTIVLIGVIVWSLRVHKRLQRLLAGKDAATLEDAISSVNEGLTRQNIVNDELLKQLDGVHNRLRKSIRGTATVRFNPFEGSGSGGNQSFATAFIDEDGNGVVISSLYGRDRFSAFAKPVSGHKPEFELSNEEQEALSKAQDRLRD